MSSRAKIPVHVAIIMDGNGRWAKAQGKERIFGHARGTDSVRSCLKAALRTGVKYLTLYAFSTENWGRPREEVDGLMELLCDSIIKESPELQNEGVRVLVIGNRSGLSEKVRDHIERIERETARGEKLTLVLAVNYSSRSEIAAAAAAIAERTQKGVLYPDTITEKTVEQNLSTYGIPDPDILIRTGGEQRLSNFLLWQAAYTELYFTSTMWPDFGETEFTEALGEYSRRERRFGLVDEQI